MPAFRGNGREQPIISEGSQKRSPGSLADSTIVIMDNTYYEIHSRQIMMDEIGEHGQRILAAASVLVVGCGGLGAPVLCYLTAMGIGHLGLCDGDSVALSNLNRQLLFTVQDIGKPKASTARERIMALNPQLTTTVYDCYLDMGLATEIIPSYDIIVDCLDNFATRFILNDACIEAKRPLVHAGIEGWDGQLMTITPGTGPCLRCFLSEKKQKTPEKPFGVIGTTPGILGTMQALEVLKYLLGLPVCNSGLLIFRGMEPVLEKVQIQPHEKCVCRTCIA